jgi:hypothetical protein
MALRLVSASVSIGAAATACSLFAPSDSEFFAPPGASGTGAAGAAANAGTQSSAGGSMASAGGTSGEGGSISGAAGAVGSSAGGGRGGTTVDAAVGAGGTGAADAGGGSSGSGHAGTQGAAGTAGRGGVAGTGGSGASGGSSGGTGARGGSAGSSTDSGADSSGCEPRLVFDFESGSLVGVTSDLPLEVRTFDGSQALALDIAQLNAVSYVTITLSICATGTVDLRDKTLSFRVYFQGLPQSSSSLIVQAWLPDRPASAAFLGGLGPSTGAWTSFSGPLRESDFSGASSTITIEAASTGVAFMGTMWLDDFRIQ